MANLQQRSISSALKAQVSCLSWSSKGKQLCAGLADGGICQMTPEGEVKADIPKPPNVDNSHGRLRTRTFSICIMYADLISSILSHLAGEQPLPRHPYHFERYAPCINLSYHHQTAAVGFQFPEDDRPCRAVRIRKDTSP
jgi:hypothetical protein